MIKGFAVLMLFLVPIFITIEFLDFDQSVRNRRPQMIGAVTNLISRFIIAGVCLIAGILLLVTK